MARCLIIGCGCRGRSLARALSDGGHSVRGTTRDPARALEIARAGAEPFVGDPDRVATLWPALDHVTVALILLGSAVGQPSALAALHGSRLEMLLTRMIDTTIHGIVYEVVGSAGESVLAAGGARVRAACEDTRTPYALLDADPAGPETWVGAAVTAVDSVLR